MRILITTDLFTVITNGVVTSVKNLYDELKNRGHDVRILTLSESGHSYIEGDVTYIRSMPLPVYPDVRMPTSYHHKLIKELINWNPEVIHSQCEFFTYQFALYISKHTKAPIIHTYHTLYEQYATYVIPSKRLGVYAVKTFSRRRLKGSKRVIVPTKKIKNTLLDYNVNSPISIVPSGIDLSRHGVKLSAKERSSMRESHGVHSDDFLIIYLGRLGNEKNLDEVIRFFAKAEATYPKIRLMIVGGGPAMDHLKKTAEENCPGDKIIFAGMVNPVDVPKYYQLGDLFVSASTSETQGLTYIEACANGLPLLCRKDDALYGVAIEGENGYTYETEEEFLLYLGKIIGDPDWRVIAAKKSIEIAESYSKESFAKTVEEIYKENI